MIGHKVSGSGDGTFFPQTSNFSGVVNLVVFKNSKFFLLALMFVFLGGGVGLLLTFLTTTTEPEHKVKGGLLLTTVNILY